jgi:hypothetical protein
VSYKASTDEGVLGQRGFMRATVTVTWASSVAPRVMFGASAGAATAIAAAQPSFGEAHPAADEGGRVLSLQRGYQCFGPDECGFRGSHRRHHVSCRRAHAERHRVRTRDFHRSAIGRRLRQGRKALHAGTVARGQAAAGVPAAPDAGTVFPEILLLKVSTPASEFESSSSKTSSRPG